MSEVRVPLLAVDDLSVEFRTRSGVVQALEGVSFDLYKGEKLGLVGESGSGKSVTAYAVMGLLDEAGRVRSGRAVFGGLDLLTASEAALRQIRGREAAMIFQNPRTALNPIRTVGRQIADVLLRHGNITAREAPEGAVRMLETVRIADPARRARAYPFELSGGMCQRVMIALALACNPSLLIADEPTTGLDVTTQAVIMDLIDELAAASGMATILITHDLELAAEHCDRIAVMHAGHVVEVGPARAIFEAPRHPYTARLLAATPRRGDRLQALTAIPGGLPDLRRGDLPACRFGERCERHAADCNGPPLPRLAVAANHLVACRHPL